MDIAINISLSTVKYTAWLRTSYASLGIEGASVSDVELGIDQGDAFSDFMREASREVLKIFAPRQGSVEGEPYEFSDTDLVYRFKEGTPALSAGITKSLTESLRESVEFCLYSFVTALWFRFKGISMDDVMTAKYTRYADEIDRLLFRLHD